MKTGRNAVFITATDTGMGKTVISTGMLRVYRDNGINVCGMKPVASGAVKTRRGRVSEDAVKLQKLNCIELPYELVNPVLLENPCSPDIAARLEQIEINLDHIMNCFNEISSQCDMVVVEGVGGWRTPCLGPKGMADLVLQMKCPVVLVVGMRLGCINHALLSVEAIRNDGFELAGWIANQIDPNYAYQEQTLDTLAPVLGCPLLGVVPYIEDADADRISAYLHLDGL